MTKSVGLNPKMKRSALHCHSEYSNTKNLDCIIKLKDLIYKSKEMGFEAVAITDHSCLSGHIKALNYGEEIARDNPNFKVILGDEIYLIKEREIETPQQYYHFILLAKDEIGHKYLRELSTLAWKNSWWEKGQRRTPVLYSEIETVVKEKGHLIASSACLGGMLSTSILQYSKTNSLEDKQTVVDFIEWCLKIFGEDFYIELQSGTTEEQITVNKKALQLAKCFGIKCIITDDAHYLYKEDRGLHEAFLNSRKADDSVREVGDFYEATYLKSDEDVLQRLNYLDTSVVEELCKNTLEISNKCQTYSLKQNTIVPQRPLPSFEVQHLFQDWYDRCEYIKKFAYSIYPQDLFLLSEIEKGFVERKQEFNETNLFRLNEELETLWVVSERLDQRLSAYYNLVDYLMDLIWNNAESIIGISRGSVGGAYFAYLTGVCQMNPLIYNLPWWRHLHESRPELPDVDFDSESMKRDNIIEMIRQEFTEERVLNIITFKTETSKSSVLTACRGLGISLEEAQQLADLIPVVRGKSYTIKECLEGDEESGKEPVTLFKKTINEYDGLLDIVLKIEGLISGVSSHASGLYLFNNNYIEQNSLMKTPKGLPITCWEMSDSDQVGALKVDLLTVENLDTIHETLNLLIKDKLINSEEVFRNTYNSTLHPDVLDYKTPEMFDLLGTEQGNNIFQLSTDMGMKACQMIKPKSVNQMGLVNSLMRLMSDGGETPLEKYQRFSNDIEEWYKEMRDFGLNQEEISVLEKYLLQNNGICAEQEDLMSISMCDKISGFSMKEANGLRKAVAKKKPKLIQEMKDLFYSKGYKLGTRQEMLDYVWNKQFSLSLGYSFSRNHSVPYSGIGLQQLNLLYHYPMIYSQCAALLVASSSNEGNEENNIDYGKIATSVCQSKNSGVNFKPISINKAQKGFIPLAQDNVIIAGLKGISGVNNEFADKIIANRPYASIEDFIIKVQPLKTQMLSLIKAGAFDEFEPNRQQAMVYYINYILNQENSYKDKLTGANLETIKALNILPEDYMIYLRYYNFNKYITSSDYVYKKEGRKTYIIAKGVAFTFFDQHYTQELLEDRDYYYTKEGIIFEKSAYNKIYKQRFEKLINFINTPEFLAKYNSTVLQQKFNDIWDKYCLGSVKDWEFDSYNYYVGDHALKNVNVLKYNLSSFSELPEKPIIEEEYEYKGRTCYKYKLSRICGVVLDNDRTKHTITLLTHNNEVVKIKYYGGQFIAYNTPITEVVDNKKIVRDESWLKRGNLLVLVGYRNDEVFVPRTYAKSIYRHSTALIEDYDDNGNLTIRELRYGEKERTWKDN